MAVESEAGERPLSQGCPMDALYEFDAPHFFDFVDGETPEEASAAEVWFVRDHIYAPSPFMPKIKKERSVQLGSLCDFGGADTVLKENGLNSGGECSSAMISVSEPFTTKSEVVVVEVTNHNDEQTKFPETCGAKWEENHSSSHEASQTVDPNKVKGSLSMIPLSTSNQDICTPGLNEAPVQGNANGQNEKKEGNFLQKPSALQPKNISKVLNDRDVKSSKSKDLPPLLSAHKGLSSTIRSSKKALLSEVTQENQAIKRQKLDGGRLRQILDIKSRVLTHKSKLGQTVAAELSKTLKPNKDETKDRSLRKVYVREQVKTNPFVSAAEMVQKFHSSTRELSLPCMNKSLSHDCSHMPLRSRPVLRLTQPKEPELQTTQRFRPAKVKSTEEIEEEMLAKMPKFKARPVNKKIFEAPTLPPVPRVAPQLPEFKEFHLKTMERAALHAGTMPPLASTSSEVTCQNHNRTLNKLTEPRTPKLETSFRARPTKIKTTEELELEELEKAPKFKARPLDRKILECKGAVGLIHTHKRQLTIPQKFHFATDERLPPSKTVADLLDKLSLSSYPQHQQQLPRITTPHPFHLHTEERGMWKERKFAQGLQQRQMEEEIAKIPKANPYPYTTDIPVIPPKPAPKECTKPEAFQLRSLIRHEEEVQKQTEERERMEKEEAMRRIFKAAPIMNDDPIPLPGKQRKPLTEVQEFVLQVEQRAADRSEFDKKLMLKEMMHKRYREECEMNQKIEEEKELKQMRREMVPHARPVPNFANPFLPQKSSKVTTEPKSPKLRVVHRRAAATVSQMR